MEQSPRQNNTIETLVVTKCRFGAKWRINASCRQVRSSMSKSLKTPYFILVTLIENTCYHLQHLFSRLEIFGHQHFFRRTSENIFLVSFFKPNTLEGLCVEAIFSSLFQPQFRAHEPGRKIADAASGHCHNSHTWPFGQEEVQLREFVSTLHVQPLSGPGNLAADETREHSESCTTPSPTARLLWHLQRALHQAACHATACARCLNIA